MRRIFVIVLISVAVSCFFSGCMGKDVTGKNVEIEKYGTDDTYVCYYTKCPECGHKSFTGKEVNKGETYKGMSVCANCGYMFEYTIER